MGTRSATKIKLRNAPYKCDTCGRRLMSAEALKSHQECLHNISSKLKTKTPSKQPITKPKIQPPSLKTKNVKLEKNAISKPKSTKKVFTTPKPGVKTPVKIALSPTVKSNPIDLANCAFDCPKCVKTFRVYFSAHRHIQKSHCVNSSGEKVSPNSSHLIKPIVRELCAKCKKRTEPTEQHTCDSKKIEHDDLALSMFYVCTGCKQQFISLRLFDLHVAGLHCDGVESMFFPSTNVFQNWKDEVEQQTKVKYSILGNYNSKKMYRCTFLPEGSNTYDDTTTILCPSAIVVQEFSKGIQVHFYKDHYGHSCGGYVLPENYKKFSLTALLKNADGYTQIEDINVDENDLYLQFKKLMECIVLDAAKINIEALKILIGKALDMTSILNDYEEDPDSDSISLKRDIENKISGVLGELGSNKGEKRKIGFNIDKLRSEPITKRFKTRMCQDNPNDLQSTNILPQPPEILHDTSIKIINSFSLAEQDIDKAVNAIDSESELELPEKIDKKSKLLKEKVSKETKSSKKDETEIVTVKEEEASQSPSSFADSYKNFVVKHFKYEPDGKKPKCKNKTNISHIKNRHSKSVSPKPLTQNATKETKLSPKIVKPQKLNISHPPTIKSKSSEPALSLPRPVDYKYEVKERENACNILILKI